MTGAEERLGEADGEDAPRRPARGGRPPRGLARGQLADERAAAEREAAERDFTEERELSDDERLEMFLASHYQSVLPDLPPIPGYHVCWLTTSNPRDSLQWRIRMGYSLLRVEDVPGWDGIGVKAGNVDGVVGINEMVAAKIPLRLYNMLMKAVHHSLPLAEEEKLRASVGRLKEEAQSYGSLIEEGDGTANVVQRAKPMPELRE